MAQSATIDNQITFKWEGKNKDGAKVKGEAPGPSQAMIRAMLRRQGIKPTRVTKKRKSAFSGGRKRIKSGDIALFSRQFATMMKAGVPMVQSLDLIAKSIDNPTLAKLVGEIKDGVEGGSTLAETLSNHPKYFDDLYVNLVSAGERSGTLEALLDKIATYKEKTEAIKAKVKKALFYPTAVICVAIIVTGILLVFVVPEFQSLFQGFGADLPAFTLMVIHLSHVVQGYWWLMLAALFAAGFAFAQARKRSRKFRRQVDRFTLRIPIIGDIVDKAAVARYARTLSTMFAAGVPLVEALDAVARAAGNIIYEEAVFQIRDSVATGQQLNSSMQQAAIFPNMATQMVAIGEESGALDTMCAKVADYFEEQVDNKVDGLSTLLEPLIMVVIGILVGGLVIAMYLPIFKLGSVV